MSAPSLEAPQNNKSRFNYMPFLVGLLLIVSLFALWQGWNAAQRVRLLERELVKRQQDSTRASTEARVLAKQSEDSARDTSARTALLEARVAEVALQRGQLEDLIQSLARSRDENLLVDVEASLRVALQQATLTASAEPLITALKSADERIVRAGQPRLDGVRRALARDLDRVKSIGLADTASLVIKLDEAIRLVDEIPLANERSRPTDKSSVPQLSTHLPQDKAQAPITLEWSPSTWWPWGKSVWQNVSTTVWSETQGLIRVRKIEYPEAILLSPEQGFFIRENLKLRLLNARMALLSRQYNTVQTDLTLCTRVINQYFDTSSRKTQLLLDLIKQVQKQSVRADLPRLDETFTALSAVVSGH